ncbi:unnamed protein product [Cylindrotheca closterium]|uniref:Major facilitator superfamily (MFS) profile domain-containing protein n=1 Tax=Cylindrotheca closterium TaxID=2856 RepID=A0AAD2FJY4_9STRA|nr:unnamed protein product [Cylindrotheca closterium]
MMSRVLALLLSLAFCYGTSSAFYINSKKGMTNASYQNGYPMRPTNTPSILAKRQQKIALIANVLESSSLMMAKDPPDGDEEEESDSWLWIPTLVLPLQLVYISNQWSRSSLYYLVNFSQDATPERAMNLDIGFSQAQYGLLASLAFTSLFAIASLGAGIASDKYNRKQLTVLATIGWSVATLGTAFSTDYTQVLVCRVLMGLACAFATPTAYTLINDRVPKDRTSLATSLYGTGVAFGGALASLSILLANQIGWKDTTIAISVAGFASAGLSAVLLKDDKKNDPVSLSETNDEEDGFSGFVDDIGDILKSPRARWIYLASFLRFSSGLCIGVWSAPYFKLAFPDNSSDYAVAQALITAVAGSASGLLGGYVADQLGSDSKTNGDDSDKNALASKLLVPVVGSALAAPAWYFAVHSTDSFQTAMIWLSVEYFIAESWFGPTISTLLGTVTKGGTAQGLFTLTGAVANLAPTLLGVLYTNTISQGSGSESSAELLQWLSPAVCLGYVLSAVCFAISAQAPATSENEANAL